MLRTLVILSCLLPLAACKPKTISEMDYSERMALAKQIGEKCTQIAGKVNSPEWKACFFAEAQAFDASSIRNREAMAALGDAFSGAGAGFSAASGSRMTANCTSNRVAGTVYTNCY